MREISVGISSAQMEIWLAQQLRKDLFINIAEYLQIDGVLDIALFMDALHRVLQEAIVLHVNFSGHVDRPVQFLRTSKGCAPSFIDVSAQSDPFFAAQRAMRELAHSPFDLGQDALFRWCLIRLSDEHHIF
ncbi:MAG: hypothetical protein CBCREVIR_2790, partial [Candidatus Burkholderia crenata]